MFWLRQIVALCLSALTLVSLTGAQERPKAQNTPSSKPAKLRPCIIKNPKLTEIVTPKLPPGTGHIIQETLTVDMITNRAKALDWDCDGISNYYDKCLDVPSKNNRDRDGDGWGDVCDKISSDLEVRMTRSRTRIRVGAKVRFSITIVNRGPLEEAAGIQIVDLFPRALRVDSITTTNGECSEVDGGMLCDAGPLGVGKSMTITVMTTATRPGRIVNTVKVENGIGDLIQRNNKATTALTIIR